MATMFGHGRAAFAFIFVTVLLDALAFGIAVPVVPRMIAAFEGGDTASAAAIYGWFGTAWAAMQFVCSPILGALSDRFGRRRVILLSSVGLGLDYLLVAHATSLGWLFVGRVISGMTSATYGTAAAYVADVTPVDRRAARFGTLGIAFALGLILGPSLGGLLSTVDLRAPFWCAAILNLANAAYGAVILPESLPPHKRARFAWRRAEPIGAVARLRAYPYVLSLAIVSTLSRLAHEALPSTFVLYTDHRYGWDGRAVGLTLALIGLCSVAVQAGLVGRAVAAIGERPTLVLGLSCGAMGLAAIAAAPTGTWLLAGTPVLALWGLAGPTLQSAMTQRVPAESQGALQGAVASLHGLASLFAPVVFTQTFAAAVGGQLARPFPGLPFLVAGLLLVTAAVMAWSLPLVSQPSSDAGSTVAYPSTLR